MAWQAPLAGLALLAGCALTPAFQPPALPIPPQWQGQAGRSAIGSRGTEGWWTRFGSPELERLIGTAQRNNYDLRAAAGRLAQARAQVRIAASSLYPALALGGSVSRSKGPSIGRGGAGSEGEDSGGVGSDGRNSGGSSAYSAAIDAGYELDLWGKNRLARDAARARAEASGFDRRQVAIDLAADVARGYFQVLSLADRLQVAHRLLGNAQDLLDLLETRYRWGAASALEIAQQKTTLSGIQADIPVLEQQQQQTLNALAILLAQAPEGFRLQSHSLAELRLPVLLAGLPSELLRRRPDIRRAESELRAAHSEIGVARAALFPSVQLTAEGGIASAALSSLLDSGSALYHLAAGITAPLFQGGRLVAEVDRSKARRAELAATYAQTVLVALREVEDALTALARLSEQEAAQREALRQAREADRLADLRFRGGAADFLTVLDAQRTRIDTENALEPIRFARFEAAVALYRALGGGWGSFGLRPARRGSKPIRGPTRDP